MLGIIGAMEQEIYLLRDAMENKTAKRLAGMEFLRGTLYTKEVVLCKCSPGKVNAAICTQVMLDHFAPACVINLGVAGGVGDAVGLLDVVVADKVCQHDVDTTNLGDEPGFLSGLGTVMLPCDRELSAALMRAAAAAGVRAHSGVVATGDQFISSRGERERIRETFGALAVEMEGGSVGHVCYRSAVPFAVLRSISDGGSQEASLQYPAFCAAAAKASMEILKQFLNGSCQDIQFQKVL